MTRYYTPREGGQPDSAKGGNGKFYGIEKTEPNWYGDRRYRYYSLYNGARGGWHWYTSEAIKEGQAHQKIIESLLNQVTP